MGVNLGDRAEREGPAVRSAGRDGRERWFVPPRLRTTDQTEERHATWLELFFDLVFVVAITELSRELVFVIAIILGLALLESVIPPLAVASGLAFVLAAMVYAERMFLSHAAPA